MLRCRRPPLSTLKIEETGARGRAFKHVIIVDASAPPNPRFLDRVDAMDCSLIASIGARYTLDATEAG